MANARLASDKRYPDYHQPVRLTLEPFPIVLRKCGCEKYGEGREKGEHA